MICAARKIIGNQIVRVGEILHENAHINISD